MGIYKDHRGEEYVGVLGHFRRDGLFGQWRNVQTGLDLTGSGLGQPEKTSEESSGANHRGGRVIGLFALLVIAGIIYGALFPKKEVAPTHHKPVPMVPKKIADVEVNRHGAVICHKRIGFACFDHAEIPQNLRNRTVTDDASHKP